MSGPLSTVEAALSLLARGPVPQAHFYSDTADDLLRLEFAESAVLPLARSGVRVPHLRITAAGLDAWQKQGKP